MKTRDVVIRITLCGVFIAVAIVLCRLLGFPATGIVRFELSFLPIAIIAWLYGPIYAGVSYGIADLIGAAIFTGINPFITLEKVLIGVVFGLFFYKRNPIGWKRISISCVIVAVLLDFAMMAFIFRFAFAYEWGTAFLYRGLNSLANVAVRIAILIILDKLLIPQIQKLYQKEASK